MPAPPSNLRNGMELSSSLSPEWAVVPAAIGIDDDRLGTVMADPGGDLLSRLRGQIWELRPFLRAAIAISDSVAKMHSQGIIHNDLRPENILLDKTIDKAWFAGFENASKLPRQRKQRLLFVNALPYLSPEQTGRMNRSVDSRTDLYSLGVTFYEMLAGVRPFNASDPLEWIHCHIARVPPALTGYRPDIPPTVCAIVHKLLSKEPEDRYQTASGLQSDLQHCLDDTERFGSVRFSSLAVNEVPDRLLIPERLYGREREFGVLLRAFERMVRVGSVEFVLVSGYSGIGKSSLVNELQKILVLPRGNFASGKFDQYKRDVPYATLAQALRVLVDQILGKDKAEVERWRVALQEAVGSNGILIVNLVPEFQLIVGPQPAIPDLPARDAQNRFHLVLRRLLNVFAQPQHPLAIFLDDLQWLDTATLEFLQRVVIGREIPYLILVGAYRDNEVTAAHPLMRVISEIRKSGVNLEEIVLEPLRSEDLRAFTADALHATMEEVQGLSALLMEKTAGNPFFVIEFLTTLNDEELVYFDREQNKWAWDLERIRSQGYTDNVVELMAAKLSRLPEPTLEVLQTLACLGNRAPASLLCRAAGKDENELSDLLWDAVQPGLILHVNDIYSFLHDRVQEAAYSLIKPGDRSSQHLRIARRLVEQVDQASIRERVFDVVNQFNRALPLLESDAERLLVSELNLQAGLRAKAATAFASALTYFRITRDLLAEHDWQFRYQLGFEVELNLAECEFLTGDLQGAESRLLALRAHAVSFAHRSAVAWLRITLATTKDGSEQAIAIFLEYMQEIGIEWSAHPGADEARKQYDRLQEAIGERSVQSLINLRQLHNEDKRWLLDVLVASLPPAFFTDQNLVSLILFHAASLSLEFGNSDASALAYAYIGMILGPYFGDYRKSLEFGTLGYDLVENRGMGRYRSRVYLALSYHVLPFAEPMSAGVPLCRRSFEAALESGDLTYCGFSSVALFALRLAASEPLEEVEAEAASRLEFMRNAKFGLIVDILTSQMQFIRALRGLTASLQTFDESGFSHHEFEAHLSSDRSLAIAECWYWIRKLAFADLIGDYRAASSAAAKAKALIWSIAGHVDFPEYHFFAALAVARLANPLDESWSENEAVLREHYRLLSTWAEHSPHNFECREALIAGEIARLNGNHFEAMRHYERAIQSARRENLPQNEGLACEVAAQFYRQCGFPDFAEVSLRNARYAFLRWGALGKVRLLDEQYPTLRQTPVVLERASGETTSTELDLGTLVKSSLAVAVQVGVTKVLETLLTSVLEHSGASRGVLLFPRNEGLRMEAEADVQDGKLQVHFPQRAPDASDVPLSIVHYVERTREMILVEETQTDQRFTSENYFRAIDSGSCLCIPLLNQGGVVALLYLENKLATRVFTPSRRSFLELIAAQAAISIENAVLEEKESLLKEVHHRVKNNLQLVSSLLSLQSSRVSDPVVAELLLESRNRVRSMALVHENLYQAGNLSLIPMDVHLKKLCAHLSRAYNLHPQQIEVRVTAGDLHLNMDQAVPCSLIVNELVSNALKHAFPNGSSGLVSVEFSAVSSGKCKLMVADSGVGLPADFDLRNSSTLGLQLVQDLAAQLHTDVDVVRGSGGTSFRLSFDVNAGNP
jgi:predicted ATPase/two-component sensor histidine kinase